MGNDNADRMTAFGESLGGCFWPVGDMAANDPQRTFAFLQRSRSEFRGIYFYSEQAMREVHNSTFGSSEFVQ